MYVKEDLIIPHHFSFYDLIVTKARGKSGPLFHFDVHDDIRLVGDTRIEKDESHPGKVVERSWYEKNKHIFPASRWEIYDEKKKWEKYTIGGDVWICCAHELRDFSIIISIIVIKLTSVMLICKILWDSLLTFSIVI